MRKLVLALVMSLVIAAPTFAQQTERQHQIITHIEALLQELRGTLPPPIPPAIVVSDPAGIQTALNTSGNYKIAPGEYVGNFVFSASDVTVDATDVVFRPTVPSIPTVRITGSRVKITGLTVLNGYEGGDTFNIGSNGITTLGELPRDVTLERVKLYAGNLGGKRGFGLHGVNITLKDCEAHNFWRQGQDSQAIWINNGPGPYTIDGGFFEGSGENIMVGGAKQGIMSPDAIPSDITVRNAHLYKPLEWKTKPGSVKNLFELKSGRRVLVENCVLENNWKDAQAGSAILLKSDNQEGVTPWIITEDVTFRNNIIKNSPTAWAVNMVGLHTGAARAQRTRNIVFEGNLFVGVSQGFMNGNGVDGLTIKNNTILTITGSFINAYNDGQDGFKTKLTFTGNVVHSGAYGVIGSGAGVGVPQAALYFDVLNFSGNVIEKSASRYIDYGPGPNTLVEPGQLMSLLDSVTFKYLPGGAGY